jgi:preprotein translocase subunit SecG
LYHKGSFNYYARIMTYMRLRVLLEVCRRARSWKTDRERARAAGLEGLRGNQDRRVWDLHYQNFLKQGWVYLRASNFVHHCTDGPECPVAYAFSKNEAHTLFAKFSSVQMKVAHFPLKKYRRWVPFSLEKCFAARVGWYLFIFASKGGQGPVSAGEGEESSMSHRRERKGTKVLVKAPGILTTLFIVLALALPTETKAFSNDFWVCSTNNPSGNGTLANPFDGSTQSQFDRVMNSMPPSCRIHLLSGTYQTYGVATNAWIIKTGQKVIGSGIDNTIIHLNGSSIGNTVAGGTNIEVLDLTVDASGRTNQSGIYIFGDHSAIRRVKAVNFENSTIEIFALSIVSYWFGGPTVFHSEGNVIEECEVDISDQGPFSAINVGGGPSQYQSASVRNNRVIATPRSSYNNRFGINLSSNHDSLVEANYVYGVDAGFYSDSGSNTNVMILNNTFQNVLYGVHTLYHAHTNILLWFNNISLATRPPPLRSAGFDFQAPTSGKHRNLTMSQNTIQIYGAPGSAITQSSAIQSCSGVRFVGNRIDPRLRPEVSASSGVQILDNTDLDGNSSIWDREPAHSIVRSLVTGPSYQILATDRYIGIRNGGVTATTIRLPKAEAWSGEEFVIAREDGGTAFTLMPVAGETINGTNSLVISKGSTSPAASVTVISDGKSWFAR